MSFILDAIKKSEDERQRKKAPDTFSYQTPNYYQEKNSNNVLRGFLLLVALMLLAAIMWWLIPKINENFNITSFPLTSSNKNTVKNSSSVSTRQNVSENPEVTQPVNNSITENLEKELPQEIPIENTQNVRQVATPGAKIYGADDELPPMHQIKELWEMPADFISTVPDMNFELHQFSKTPEKRVVIINGRFMKEGKMVTSKMKLRVITSTGVILHYRGKFFHVDVLEQLHGVTDL